MLRIYDVACCLNFLFVRGVIVSGLGNPVLNVSCPPQAPDVRFFDKTPWARMISHITDGSYQYTAYGV